MMETTNQTSEYICDYQNWILGIYSSGYCCSFPIQYILKAYLKSDLTGFKGA